MYLWQWLPIHLPSQHDLVDTDFSPRYRNDIVVDLSFLDVGIHAHELDMFCSFL